MQTERVPQVGERWFAGSGACPESADRPVEVRVLEVRGSSTAPSVRPTEPSSTLTERVVAELPSGERRDIVAMWLHPTAAAACSTYPYPEPPEESAVRFGE